MNNTTFTPCAISWVRACATLRQRRCQHTHARLTRTQTQARRFSKTFTCVVGMRVCVVCKYISGKSGSVMHRRQAARSGHSNPHCSCDCIFGNLCVFIWMARHPPPQRHHLDPPWGRQVEYVDLGVGLVRLVLLGVGLVRFVLPVDLALSFSGVLRAVFAVLLSRQ